MFFHVPKVKICWVGRELKLAKTGVSRIPASLRQSGVLYRNAGPWHLYYGLAKLRQFKEYLFETSVSVPSYSKHFDYLSNCLFLVGFFKSSPTTRLYRGRVPRLTILRAVTHETERGDHDFCHSWSHYGVGGQSGDRTHGLLTMSRALYRLSSCASHYLTKE